MDGMISLSGNAPLIFTSVLLFFVAVGLLFGLLRGTKKAIIRFAVVVLSAFIAVGFSAGVTDAMLYTPIAELPVDITDSIGTAIPTDITLHDMLVEELRATPEIADLMEAAPTMTDFILTAPRAIVGVILFVVFFFVVKFVLGIVEWLFKLIFVRGSKGHLVGAIIGAAQGAFCALVVLVPVFGMMTVADSAIDAARAAKTEDTPQDSIIVTITDFDEQIYAPLKEDPAYGILKSFGVDAMCTEVFYAVSTGYNAAGEEVNFFRTLNETVPALIQVLDLQSVDFENLSPDDLIKIRNLASTFADTPLVVDTLSEVLSGASSSLLAGESFMGITYPTDLDENTDAFLTDVLSTLANADKETLASDLPEIIDVVCVLMDSGVLDAMSSPDGGNIDEILSDEEFLEELLGEMAESALLSEIAVSAINSFGMTTIAESLSVPKNGDEAYAAMVDGLDKELAKYSDLDMSSVVLLSTQKTEAELATDAVAKILLHYAKNLAEEHARAAAYSMLAAHCTAGATPATKDDIEISLALTAIVALQPDTYEPACVTLDDILITDKQIFSKMSEEERKEEISKLSKIVTGALALIDELQNNEGEPADSLAILPAVGELMNTMTDSVLLSEASQNIMVHFVSSDAVSDILDESAVTTLKEKISEGAVDYAATMSSISASYRLVEFLNSPPDVTESEPEKLAEIVEMLFTSIDETTIEILQKTVNNDFLAKMGVPEEAVAVSGIVVQTLFSEIGKTVSGENGELNYAAEGEAIQSLIGLLMKNESGEGEEISDEFLTDMIIDTILDSNTITNTLISVCENPEIAEDMAEWLNEDDRAAAAEVIAEYEAKLELDDERARECIAAIRVLLGITA